LISSPASSYWPKSYNHVNYTT